MSWTSLLPQSPAALSSIEWWLWFAVFCCIIGSGLLGFTAREVGRYKTSILQEELDSKTVELQTIAEEAKRKAIETELKHTPRSLSEEVKIALIKKLKQYDNTKVDIIAVLSDNESIIYAQDFFQIFKAANWQISNNDITRKIFKTIPIGTYISIKDTNNPPDGIIELCSLLNQYNISYQSSIDQTIDLFTIRIVIGTRK